MGRKLVAVLALLAVASSALAEGDAWLLYATGARGSNHWIHKSRAKKLSDTRIEVWTKEVLAKPESIYINGAGPKYAYSVARQEVDCRAETSATMSITFHLKDGSLVASNSRGEPHEPSAPESVGELLIITACSLLARM